MIIADLTLKLKLMYNRTMEHNKILGVSNNSSESEIQSAFRKAAMEVHPDLSSSPEAAEAFQRIKEARDQLIAQARKTEGKRDDSYIQQATQVASTVATNSSGQQVDDMFADMNPEEIAHVQMLDNLVFNTPKPRFFRRETEELSKHRKKLATSRARINGKY